MKLPTHDWQFWVVSGLAAAALVYLCRGLLPGRKNRRRGRRATLTISGKSPDRKTK